MRVRMDLTLYGLALFLHILGVIALFGGFMLAQRGVAIDQARKMVPSGGAMILVGGLSMVFLGGAALDTPWIGPTLLALLVLTPLAMFALADPSRRATARWIANGLALASVFNMTTKPNFAWISWLALGVGALAGFAIAAAQRSSKNAAIAP